MSFNTAKIINVYYKSDRKPYDANGKPISYFGEDFVGSNEATEIRFYMPNEEDLGAVQCAVDVKRANGDKRYDLLTKVVDGLETYYKLELNDWYSAYVGKVTIAFKAYKGGITIVDGVITSVTAPVYVSDIFHLQIAYAPNSTEEVPPFDPSDVTTFLSALSAKLNVNNGIFVIASSLPSLVGGVYNGQWFLVKNNADGSLGKLYYINGSTAEEVELNMETLKLTPTGNGDITTNTGKLNWEQPNGTVQLGLYNDVNMEIGEDVFYYGKASATITKGQVIQFGGYQGDHILIKPAVPAEINANPKLIMGIAKHNIANGDFGYVLHFGKLDGIDTGSFVAGNLLYFSSSSINNGELTSTIPTAPNAKILMCSVIKAETSGPSNNGVYQVRITFEPKLGDLQDVNVSSALDNQILRYDGATSRWENNSDLTTAETNITEILNGTTTVGKALADQNGDVIDTTYLKLATASSTYVPLSSKGVANGVAPLDSSNKIPSIHLPGGVDDIKEFANLASFPLVGEASIIYVALDTNKIYRWSGSAYVEISSSLALGTTNTTAFPGDRGLATETKTDNIVSGVQGLTDTRITNSAIGVSPLIVNGITGTTTNLQQWQINGTTVALVDNGIFRSNFGISNRASENNAVVYTLTTGTTIQRNINDANPALVVNENAGTGDILRLQFAGANKLEITKDGFINQNGTRLFHQTANVNNTFFGNLSGKTTVSGNGNTAFGFTSLEGITSGSNNTAIGADGGRTITSGAGNTFLGQGAGFNASQLATASNSTGIGSGAYTDKSNQMVLGNASVTEFVFNRNTGALVLMPTLAVNRTDASYRIDVVSTFGLEAIRALRQGSYGAVIRLGRNGVSETASIDYPNDANISFSTASTERLRILADGKVGIGTSSPDALLTLKSTDTQIRLYSTSPTSNQYATFSFNSAGNNTLDISTGYNNDANKITFSPKNVTSMTLLGSGLVGIGETSPTAQLQVKSGATNRIPLIIDTLTGHNDVLQSWRVNTSQLALITNGGRFGSVLGFGHTTFANSYVQTPSTGTIISRNVNDANPALIVNLENSSATGNIQVWQKAGTAKAWINGDGYFFGFGVVNTTSSANSTIDALTTGTLISRNVNDANVTLKVRQFNASASGRLQEWIQGSTTLAYTDNAGDFYNFTGTYGTISDLRLKENVIDARNYTEDLMKLRVVKYSLKKDKEATASKLGFIAQEVEQVFPNMVQTTKTEELEDMKSIKMSVLIPMLVKTIQEQQKQIDELIKKVG